MDNALLNVLLLEFQVGLRSGFRFGKKLDDLVVYLIDKQAVKLTNFLVPSHDGVDKGKA
jgi:hypothetical protein